jgi:hypothetical protein
MARLQNTTQAQTLPPPPLQPQVNLTESVPLADWNKYGFTIRASRIRSWIAESRVNGIMREGAVLRFGQRYYVNPTQLNAWMTLHGNRTRLTRGTQPRRGQAQKAASTDGKEQKEQQAPQSLPTQPTQTKGQRHHLTDAQVRQSRNQLARAAPENKEMVIARLAKRYGFTEKAIREAATGRTYTHLPMPKAQQAQPRQSGRKTKTTQAVETAGAA